MSYAKLLIVVFAIMVAFIVVNNSGQTKTVTSPTTLIIPDYTTMPAEEQQFISVINEYADACKKAKNELQELALRDQRIDALAQVLNNNRRIKTWHGTIDALGTNTEGDAFLSVKIDPNISINTSRLILDGRLPIAMTTEIKKGDPIFQSLFNLQRGDIITFSGSFLPPQIYPGTTAHDYIDEFVVSNQESMTEPEFVFRFSSVNKIP